MAEVITRVLSDQELLEAIHGSEGPGLLEPVVEAAVWAAEAVGQNGRKAVAATALTGALLGAGAMPAAAHERGAAQVVRIERGDTLSGLAAEQGTTVNALASANGIQNIHRIQIGDTLTVTASSDTCATGQVKAQAGDTVTSLAPGQSAEFLAANPRVASSSKQWLYEGECYNQTAQSLHVVKKGDTVSDLAGGDQKLVQAIIEANGLTVWKDDVVIIHPGDELIIPDLQPAVTATADLDQQTAQLLGSEHRATIVLPKGQYISDMAKAVSEVTGVGFAAVQDAMLSANEGEHFQLGDPLDVPGFDAEIVNQALGLLTPAPTEVSANSAEAPTLLENVPAAQIFTPEVVREMLPASEAEENIDKYLPLVLAALEEQGIADQQMVLYALSTIRSETASFAPIPEYASGAAYQGRLGNVQPGDGEEYKGRGLIQLTGRDNYRHMGEVLGINLINNPDLALEPETAARILAVFLKERESRIRHALNDHQDMAEARAVVNGGTNGLEEFSESYQDGLELTDKILESLPAPVPEAAEPALAPETAGSDPRLLHPLIDNEIRTESNGVETVMVDGIRIRIEAAMNLAQLLEAAKADGLNLGSSPRGAHRSPEQQLELFVENGCQDGECDDTPVAKPGTSNHESHPDDPLSYAVDFRSNGLPILSWNDWAAEWLQRNAGLYDFFGKIPSEPWHWSGTGR